jgi:HPt (histidine-containing phosphotransfer) domain-containing protein
VHKPTSLHKQLDQIRCAYASTSQLQTGINEMTVAIQSSLNQESQPEEIDLAALTAFGEINTAGEPDLVVELIDLYLSDGAERVTQIKHAAVTADRILLKKAVHTFKGSSGSLGFHQIVELCEQLERVQGQDNLKALVQRLELKFAGVCAALREFRQSRIG